MHLNEVKVWIDEALEPVEFLRASFLDFSFPAHLHETFAIGVIERGAQRFSTRRGQSEMMHEGTLCAINPGEVHEGAPGTESGWQYRMFYPTPSLVSCALRDDLQACEKPAPELNAHVIADSELFGEFLMLHQLSNQFGDLLERESRTLVFLRRFFARHSGAPETPALHLPRTVGIVKEMLHALFTESVSIRDLAYQAGVSETQVIRAFSAQTGIAPHAYLVALRVEHAKRLIKVGLPLATVAAECGFTDQSHFHRHFKRLTGITPGVFAKALCAR